MLFSRKYSGVCVRNKERDHDDSDHIARPDQNARAARPKQPQDAVVSANNHVVASLATVKLLLTARAHPQRQKKLGWSRFNTFVLLSSDGADANLRALVEF